MTESNFTKKDYNLIARAIKDERLEDESKEGLLIFRDITNRLADYLEKDNPRFDRNKFFKACGTVWI